MQIPLKITFKDIPPSAAVEAKLRSKAEKLEHYSADIISCRITVVAPHHHKHKGNLYSIKIEITVPGEDIQVSRPSQLDHAHEDIYVAIRDAFNAAYRQLEDYARRHRGKVKTHVSEPHGKILSLHPDDGYGVIITNDGREIYFHRNSLLKGQFEQLHQDDSVRFVEEMGENGPQASTVIVEGKHHVVG